MEKDLSKETPTETKEVQETESKPKGKMITRTFDFTHVEVITQVGIVQSKPFAITLEGKLSDDEVMAKINKPSFKQKLNVDKGTMVIPISTKTSTEKRGMPLTDFIEFSEIITDEKEGEENEGTERED